MSQGWITVIGLTLDLLGFTILLYEWWIAVFNEERQGDMERERERLAEISRLMMQTATNPHMQRHLEVTSRLSQSLAMSRARGAGAHALGRRKILFAVAAVLIVSGSLLQLLGALPGCCSSIGIG